MNWTPRILATLAVAAGVVVLAIWLGVVGRSPAPPQSPPPAPGQEVKPVKTTAGRSFTPRTRPRIGHTNDPSVTTVEGGTNQLTNWEEVIDELLRDETSEPNATAKRLLELFPRIPETGQAEAAQHIANLIADEDYGSFAALFTNTNTTVEVQEVIMTDLLNRPNSIKLPLLLEAAKTPGHPRAVEAKELLELYLEKDYGQDWDVWRNKLEEWLKANPD